METKFDSLVQLFEAIPDEVAVAAIAELLPDPVRPQEHKQGELFETGLAQMRWKRRKFTMVKR